MKSPQSHLIFRLQSADCNPGSNCFCFVCSYSFFSSWTQHLLCSRSAFSCSSHITCSFPSVLLLTSTCGSHEHNFPEMTWTLCEVYLNHWLFLWKSVHGYSSFKDITYLYSRIKNCQLVLGQNEICIHRKDIFNPRHLKRKHLPVENFAN